jgi:transcription termination factor Rho
MKSTTYNVGTKPSVAPDLPGTKPVLSTGSYKRTAVTRQRQRRPRRPHHMVDQPEARAAAEDRGERDDHAVATLDRPAAEAQLDRAEGFLSVAGVLELHPKGYGFLRDPEKDLLPDRSDVFVPAPTVQKYAMREGAMIVGRAQQVRPEEGARLVDVTEIEGIPAEQYRNVRPFDALTPINPEQWLRLETDQEIMTTRVIDLLAPIGKGQRALIVAPPRTGKTVLLTHIGQAIAHNYPDVHLMVLLVDERPEEVTDMRRGIPGEVLASSLDREVESHVRLSQLVIERAKRLAERGRDVFVMIDSLTRMARAFNKWVGDTGRTMTGGIDIRAMDIPKKLFATARAFEEGGSVTIVATALVETGSRMDDLIFEEFKGTGNMELVLDRQLADRRAWPAIDTSRTGTRREEKLFDRPTLAAVTALRRTVSTMHPVEAMQELTRQLAKFKSNREFVDFIGAAWRER